VIDDAAERLTGAGLSPDSASSKRALLDRAVRALALAGHHSSDVRAWFVPGRIEILGKHTDYAGGRSLLCAVERGLVVAAAPRGDRVVTLVDVVRGQHGRCTIGPEEPPSSISPHWMTFPAAVARRLARDFRSAGRGSDIAFGSDLPPASGLSSSSALVTGVFLVLSNLNDLARDPAYRGTIGSAEEAAGYAAAIESGAAFGRLGRDTGVGTHGGSEDHTAILCCSAGRVSQYRFCPVVREATLNLPADWIFAVGVSGVPTDKTGTARDDYNRASRMAGRILERWNLATGRRDVTLAAACASAAGADRLRAVLETATDPEFESRALVDRLDQFVEESVRLVPEAADAIRTADGERLGGLVDRSQELAEQRLGNQVPETVGLARSARALGAIASTAFGAGYGGSVWALVRRDRAVGFLGAWRDAYERLYAPRAASGTFFLTDPGPAALELEKRRR
jgi:galactokinase